MSSYFLCQVGSRLVSGWKVYTILPTHNSLKYFQSKAFVSKYWTGGKLLYFHWNLILQIRFQKLKTLSSDYIFVKLNIFFVIQLLWNGSKSQLLLNCVYNRTISICIETTKIVIQNEWEGIIRVRRTIS